MAWKINQTIDTVSGLTVPSGSVISYETRFKPASLQPMFVLSWSKDLASAQAKSYIADVPSGIETVLIKKDLTKAEFLSLTLIGVEDIMKQHLIDSGIPEANLEQVDILPG